MIPAWQFAGWEWVVALLATPVVFYSGWPFHRSTVMSARHRATTMDTLVTVGSLAAWTWSTVALLRGTGHVYFETAAVIVTLILLGKWLEVRSTAHAGDAIRALSARQSATATLEDGTVIARDDLGIGMRFVVRPGETIATDGVVVEGEAAVDASLVTGESAPVAVAPGAEVVGGTVAADGALTVEATRVGAETMLAQIARMVDEAQSGRAEMQRLADRIAAVFVPVVIGLALATLAGWLLATGRRRPRVHGGRRGAHHLVPVRAGPRHAARHHGGRGSRRPAGHAHSRPAGPGGHPHAPHASCSTRPARSPRAAWRLLTQFAPGVEAAEAARLFDAAAAVEARSEHPIAKAIADAHPQHAAHQGLPLLARPGRHRHRARARFPAPTPADNATADVTVGSRRLFDAVADDLASGRHSQEESGATVVFVGRAAPLGGRACCPAPAPMARHRAPLTAEAAIAVRDTVKPTSREAIDSLKALGLDVVLLTGDNERAAAAVGEELGIDRVIAEVLPGDKSDVIVDLQQGGRRVVMVGDGVNDSPALAQADVGIAIGTGADVAREASDLTLVNGDLRGVADAIRLARKTLGTIRGNLFWAFAYNVVAIPLAAAGLLNPMIAAAAMGGSSLFVVGNSLRLRGYSPQR